MTWVLNNLELIGTYLLTHLGLALPPVLASLVIAIPLARLATTRPRLRNIVVGTASVSYAIPSLALFVILPVILGVGIRSSANVVAALTIYGLALLVPATADALEAVDHQVRDAASAMGMGRAHCFVMVELPLAGPGILAALRVVSVSTISLTTVGAVLGIPSLGLLFTDGFQRGLVAEIITGLVTTMGLALILDVAWIGLGRLLFPWSRPAGGSQVGR